MTQKEIIEKVHKELPPPGHVPFADVVHRIADAITREGEKNLSAILSRLEPASIAYVHAYPDDITDGPWDI